MNTLRDIRKRTAHAIRCPDCGSGLILFRHRIMCQAVACSRYLTLEDLGIKGEDYERFRAAWKPLQSECVADGMEGEA